MTARRIAAIAALTGWAALALQLVLIVGKLGPALGLWRFFGYFTVLTNLGAALVATAVTVGSGGALAGPRARLLAATSIALVGIVYAVALRELWSPTGLQKLADVGLHSATPLLFTLTWAFSPRGGLGWRDAGWALVPPMLYFGYALARGAADGWYAYWFLNPAEQSAGELLTSFAVLVAAFAITAFLLVAIDRWSSRSKWLRSSHAAGSP